MVAKAIDHGINIFDNAWEYHQGLSEEKLGVALRGKRDKAIVMSGVCTHGRNQDVAMRMLEESLVRLQTDHLDVWQIHEVIYHNDPELIYASDGVLEALTKAKQQGKVRFVGFDGHKHPAIHLDMLKPRLRLRRDPDAAQFTRPRLPQLRKQRPAHRESPRDSCTGYEEHGWFR